MLEHLFEHSRGTWRFNYILNTAICHWDTKKRRGMCSYLYLLFFALLQKTVPAIFYMTWLKKLLQLSTKRNIPKTTQCYPEKIGKSIKWNVLKSTTTKKVRKGYLKRRQVSTTKCATLPQSVCTSFLEYKVMQILYNKLTQARLPKTTAKPSNSQMYHIKIHFTFFSFLGNNFTHHTEKGISKELLGSNIFGFLRTI